MPTFITQAFAFLVAAFPAFVAFGAVTTAINQFVAKVAPNSAVAKIVNTVSVDYLALLAELGAVINIGPRAVKKLPEVKS